MALTPNKDFACSGGVCKSLTTEAAGKYTRLQNTLNLFAASKGFAALVPDGILGPKTAEAAMKVLPKAFAGLQAMSFTPFMQQQGAAVVSAQAAALIAADPDKYYSQALAIAPAPAPSPLMPATPSAPSLPGGGAPPQSGGTLWWFWALGVGGVLAIGFGTYYLLKE